MKEYSLTQEQIANIRPIHRLFQTAVAVFANHKFGIKIARPSFSKTQEGGVIVNGRNIGIAHHFVLELNSKPVGEMSLDCKGVSEQHPYRGLHAGDPTKEEAAVAEAILRIAHLVEKKGPKALEPYADMVPPEGDPNHRFPLSAMLDFGFFKKPSAPCPV